MGRKWTAFSDARGRLPSRKAFAAMGRDAQCRAVAAWRDRAERIARAVLRELARARSVLGPPGKFDPLSSCSSYPGIGALLALEDEWNRRLKPRTPRRRAKHPTPEEIARMRPRERHFAEWDRARRLRTRRKSGLTRLENVKARFDEERWREVLADPNPDLEIYRTIERAIRAAEAERLRALDN